MQILATIGSIFGAIQHNGTIVGFLEPASRLYEQARGKRGGFPLFDVYVRRWVGPVQSCCYIRPRPRLFYSEVDPRVPCTQIEALGASAGLSFHNT